jgi:hypothetical protein
MYEKIPVKRPDSLPRSLLPDVVAVRYIPREKSCVIDLLRVFSRIVHY